VKILFNIHYLIQGRLKHYGTNPIHPYSLRAFQWYQDHGKRCHGLGDLNVTNKTNKLPSFKINCPTLKPHYWSLYISFNAWKHSFKTLRDMAPTPKPSYLWRLFKGCFNKFTITNPLVHFKIKMLTNISQWNRSAFKNHHLDFFFDPKQNNVKCCMPHAWVWILVPWQVQQFCQK
jgi:hypothetical protein